MVFGCTEAASGCATQRSASEGGYARCLATDPLDIELELGKTTLRSEGRRLSISGLERPVRVAAFSGPAPAPRFSGPALAALKASHPSLSFVLGGLGVTLDEVRHNVRALQSVPGVVLLLAGARDAGHLLRKALAEAPAGERGRIVDITAFETVRVDTDTFVPLAGSVRGRYSVSSEACGYELSDLKERARTLGSPRDSERRWLVSWHAPGAGGPFGVGRDAHGVDAGDADLAELAKRIGAAGGLFAWPAVQAGRPAAQAGHRKLREGEISSDLRLVVPRLGGPALVRADGSRQPPGLALFSLEAEGLRFLGISAEQATGSAI